MTYGVVRCSGCDRFRIADLDTKRSACPYCGRSVETANLAVRYESRDQSEARAAMAALSGFEMPKPEKRDRDPDPLSTLHYEYGKCGSGWVCAEMLAKGLTEILGAFSVSDLEEADPGKGEKLLKALLQNGTVMEVSPGKYKYV